MKNTFGNNSAKAARQSMLESAVDSQQFAPVNTVSPEVILEVGNNNGHKAVVTTPPCCNKIMRVDLYARQYDYPVYTYFVYKDMLVHEVIEDINKRLGYLDEILSFEYDIKGAESYYLQVEVISYAITGMLSGDTAEVAVSGACNEWDV